MFDTFSKARVKQMLEIDPEELKKNDLDDDTLCIHPIDFTVQRDVNILKITIIQKALLLESYQIQNVNVFRNLSREYLIGFFFMFSQKLI